MSDQRWQQFLVERNQQLEKECGRLRGRLKEQKRRAELWKLRALRKARKR